MSGNFSLSWQDYKRAWTAPSTANNMQSLTPFSDIPFSKIRFESKGDHYLLWPAFEPTIEEQLRGMKQQYDELEQDYIELRYKWNVIEPRGTEMFKLKEAEQRWEARQKLWGL
jgi:hypothetical protein